MPLKISVKAVLTFINFHYLHRNSLSAEACDFQFCSQLHWGKKTVNIEKIAL